MKLMSIFIFILGLFTATFAMGNEPNTMAVMTMQLAEEGNPNAQFLLGMMFHQGDGVQRDNVKACYWFAKAAEQGDADAQYHLGLQYKKGEGVDRDNVKACFWFKKSAEQGKLDAQYSLGGMFDSGECLVKDQAKARLWYEKAAKQGHAESQFKVGMMYYLGDGVQKDNVQAIEWFNRACDKGLNEGCEYKIKLKKVDNESKNYENKIKSKNNDYIFENFSIPYSRLDVLKERALNGDGIAAYRAGMLLYDIDGKKEEAIKYLNMAIREGNIFADLYLNCRIFGKVDKEKNKYAKSLFMRNEKFLLDCIKSGSIEAAYLYARLIIYLYDNDDEGIKFYKKAADANHMDAYRFLGFMYMKIDKELGNQFYKKGSELGDIVCRNRLKKYNEDSIGNKAKRIINVIEGPYISKDAEKNKLYVRRDENKIMLFMTGYSQTNGDCDVSATCKDVNNDLMCITDQEKFNITIKNKKTYIEVLNANNLCQRKFKLNGIYTEQEGNDYETGEPVTMSQCPHRIIKRGVKEGIFLGNECGDLCYSTIRLDNGKKYTVMCGEDQSDKFYGTKKGVRVRMEYKIEQDFIQINENMFLCYRNNKVCTGGKILRRK